MSGAKKAVKKVGKSIGGAIENTWNKTLDLNKKIFIDPLKSAAGSLTPKTPRMPDSPLMPDYELIDKDRRRRRQSKMSRTDTIMSDTLG
jgi:hypothetical protein